MKLGLEMQNQIEATLGARKRQPKQKWLPQKMKKKSDNREKKKKKCDNVHVNWNIFLSYIYQIYVIVFKTLKSHSISTSLCILSSL